MTNVLVIEDEINTIRQFKDAAEEAANGVRFLDPEETGVRSIELGQGEPDEIQLAKRLQDILTRHSIDAVLIDTDLSRGRLLQASSLYRVALAALGVPVFRYQKGGTKSRFEALPMLRRIGEDGASAIWVPRRLVSAQAIEDLPRWLGAIAAGFRAIRTGLEARPELLDRKTLRSPTDVLATLMGRPEMHADFAGYAGQNQRFFAQDYASEGYPEAPLASTYGTRLGYWLFNYILTFPGPILRLHQAAAFLNVDPKSESVHCIESILAGARYEGPFHNVEPMFWRTLLADLVEEHQGDIAKHPALAQVDLTRVDARRPAQPTYICMLSDEAITDADAAPTPDWVPPGASEARFKEEFLDELGPLAGM